MTPQGNCSYLHFTCVTITVFREDKEMHKLHCMGSDLLGSRAWVLPMGQEVMN